ncbi:hypothetical protein [Streptomyces sp. NPDC002990]
MQNIGLEPQRGHALLLAGDVAVRRRTVQVAPSANLAALGMVPVSMLLNSELPSDTTYLDGARDPNTVLTRLRTAAATPGPLLVYLSGRLTADRRGRQLHFALAGTTPGTVRYTALPWEWLGAELRGRPAGLPTVLLLDLVADSTAWPVLQEYGSLPASPCAEVYGVVSPPAFAGGGDGVSPYTRQWIDQLRRSPGRPPGLQLHALAVGAAALPPGAMVLPTARELGAPAGPGRSFSPATGKDTGPAAATTGGHGSWFPPRTPAAAPLSPAGGSGQAPPLHPPPRQQVPARPPTPAGAAAHDPRPRIHALAVSGRHVEAATLAQAWEQHVLQTYGYTSPAATQWLEIRADLARMAGDFRLATRLWTGAGRTRLAQQPPDAPEVQAAAAGALYCWSRLKDRAAAIEAGPELISLLRALPSLDPRHLKLAQQRLEFLHRTPTPSRR